MAKTIAITEEERGTVKELLAELRAMPSGQKLTPEQFMALLRGMPKMPDGWSSAKDIRDFRGPLPEDDPEYQRNHGRH